MVLFDLLPNTTRGPLAYAEIAVSRSANVLAFKPLRVLFIGQRVAGAVAANTLVRTTSVEQAQVDFGAGSQLHEMLAAYFKNNKGTETWAIPIADAGAAVAATKTLTVGGSPTAAGVIALYLAGHRVAIAVAAGEVTTATAANLNVAIAADPTCPYTATVLGSVVTITAKNAGTLGNELSVRHSYGQNEALPTGTTLVIATGVAGSGLVSYSTLALFGIMPQTQFDVIVVGANDSTNLAYVTAELLDRWGPTRMIEGVVVSGFSGDLSASLAQGALLNSPFSAQLPAKNAPNPSWAWAGAIAGQLAFEAGQDPARPFHTLVLKGILPPATSDVFTQPEKELLLHKGMATFIVGQDGSVQLHRLITNSQTNAGGAADATYLDINTPLTLSFLRYDWRTNLVTKYPRHKLANDGTNFAEGQPIMTPERGRAEAVAWFGKMEKAGLVEDVEQFKRDLVVERNPNDPNRLDFMLPINLVNQLQVVGTRIEFTL